MELLQLKYFCEAVRCENFSKTAAKFGVPPSDISQSIKRLERELGAELFERGANKISVNEEGRRFYERVLDALFTLDGAVTELCDDVRHGQIKIFAASIRRIVLATIEKFKKEYPDVEILLTYDKSEYGDFDIIVADGDYDGRGLARRLLLSEEMLLALNKNHPLAAAEQIRVADLSGESFISMGKDTGLSRTSERICAESGFLPNVSIRCNDPSYIHRCVELSFGVAIVPQISWRGLFGGDVVLRRFCDTKREIFMYTGEKKYVRECVKAFCDMLRDECSLEMEKP